MSRSRDRSRRLLGFAVLTLLAAGFLAPAALAAGKTVVATITPDSVVAGTTGDYTLTLTPTSGALGSFNFVAPTGFQVLSLTAPPAGVTLTADGTTIQGRNLKVTATSPLSVSYRGRAACTGAGSWTLVAKTSKNFTTGPFTIDPSSDLATPLTGQCSVAFVLDRGPADAAFNGNPTSENITSAAFQPSGAAMQAQILDGNGQSTAASGVPLTLQLTTNPTGATLSGPVTSTSGANGSAEFVGSSASPITIGTIGLDYALTPTAPGFAGIQSGPFSIFDEGTECAAGQSCVVHGTSGDGNTSATVTAQAAASSTTAQDAADDPVTLSVALDVTSLDCATYEEVSSVVFWEYTGAGDQTVVVQIDKSIVNEFPENGIAHAQVCYEAPVGKTFTDKFGNTVSVGLLPNCSATITTDCVVSKTKTQAGDGLITFIVADGKGHI